MWRWLIGLALIVGVLAGIFLGALNPEAVTLELAFMQWKASLGAVVAVSFSAGLAVGFLVAALVLTLRRPAHRRRSAQSSEASKSPLDA